MKISHNFLTNTPIFAQIKILYIKYNNNNNYYIYNYYYHYYTFCNNKQHEINYIYNYIINCIYCIITGKK